MPDNKQPAYLWYPGDYETDEAVKLMTYEEEGVYRRLLDHQSLHGGIPTDVEKIGRLVPKVAAARFRQLWPSMAAKFVEVDGRLLNRKMAAVMVERREFAERKRAAGRVSAQVRKAEHGTAQPERRAEQRPEQNSEQGIEQNIEQISEQAVRSVFRTAPEPSLSLSLSRDTAQNAVSAPLPPKPGKTYGRIFLIRWQIDELLNRLGPHAEAFGLDEWVCGLSSTASAQGLTFASKAAIWTWVQDEFAREVTRRKLPVVGATAATAAVRGCRHTPPCADEATHTRLDMADRRRVG